MDHRTDIIDARTGETIGYVYPVYAGGDYFWRASALDAQGCVTQLGWFDEPEQAEAAVYDVFETL